MIALGILNISVPKGVELCQCARSPLAGHWSGTLYAREHMQLRACLPREYGYTGTREKKNRTDGMPQMAKMEEGSRIGEHWSGLLPIDSKLVFPFHHRLSFSYTSYLLTSSHTCAHTHQRTKLTAHDQRGTLAPKVLRRRWHPPLV